MINVNKTGNYRTSVDEVNLTKQTENIKHFTKQHRR
jgi:hypothetical protein